MKEGVFVVFDGNDGSGKATQARLLGERLTSGNIPHEKVDFPAYDTNFFGRLIGECLSGKHGDFVHMDPKIASTLYALDRLETAPRICTALSEGKTVIADRYASSNQIHQGGKIADEKEREDFLKWLDKMEYEIVGIPRPTQVIYLRVPVETSLELLSQKRAAKNGALQDGEKDAVEEDTNYLERSHETANWLLSREPYWSVVECMKDGRLRTPEDIHEEVWKLLSRTLS